MNKEELQKKIEETEKILKQLKKELYRVENQELFENMQSNIGKFFRERNSGAGESKVIRIEGFNESNKTYKITSVYYNSMMIGWYSLDVSYGEIFYDQLKPELWEEIDKDSFYRIAGHNIDFATQSLKDKQKF